MKHSYSDWVYFPFYRDLCRGLDSQYAWFLKNGQCINNMPNHISSIFVWDVGTSKFQKWENKITIDFYEYFQESYVAQYKINCKK